MKQKTLFKGITLTLAFALWTLLVQTIDVKTIGPKDTSIGFASLNMCFHQWTGIHMTIYHITDWLGLVPIFICVIFAALGLFQLISRKSLFKVDPDIILLGLYYIVVMFCFIVFEIVPINYRPVLINGMLEASYPSSTTLLVLGVIPTLTFQVNCRLKSAPLRTTINSISYFFAAFMVVGRLFSGVHWFTDIVGAILLSLGLFNIYMATVSAFHKED